MRKLENLQPSRVFHYFEDICGIPHGSGNRQPISDYCADFAKAHGLSYTQDASGNVIIRKPATAGYEEHQTVILQGHLDMVCEKTADCTIDFERDGLDVAIDGDWVFARGTSLGGDNGIAVAMMLAILEADDLQHPPLEAVFTVDEEVGLLGAAALDGAELKGRRLLNLDSEEEGVLTVSCAGGVRANVTLPVAYEENTLPCYSVTVSGLRGGHSGIEIDKGRLNANVVLGRFLSTLDGAHIARIDGGLKDNAIPPMSTCVLATAQDIAPLAAAFATANRVAGDPDLTLTVAPTAQAARCFTAEATARVLTFLTAAPNGLIAMSEDIAGLPQTSLNLGCLATDGDCVLASFALRSSVGEEKQALYARVAETAQACGGDCSPYGDYPAWEYAKDSVVRDTVCAVWEDLYGAPPQVLAIHAGLECGYFCEKLPGLDAVSFGPNMVDIHTCRERLSISSSACVYRCVCETLKRL